MTVKTDYEVGDKVVFVAEEKHKEYPQYYPKVGTVGTVTINYKKSVEVKWEKGSTSKDDTWLADYISVIPAKEYFKKKRRKAT